MITRAVCFAAALLALTTTAATGQQVGERFRDCRSLACPEMVVVPAGSFVMGCEGVGCWWPVNWPEHTVTIGAPFAVGVYEVTHAEWDACVDAGGCGGYRPEDQWGRDSRPVGNVSWEDAQAYVEWLSKETGESYRLPSEAEWEYAARAGTQGSIPFDVGGVDPMCKYINYRVGSLSRCRNDYDMQTAPVGSFVPNAFGLYDVIGNVAEWTEDCAGIRPVDSPADGSAWVSDCVDKHRIMRGCHADCRAEHLRVTQRMYGVFSAPGDFTVRSSFVGFRVAREVTADALAEDSPEQQERIPPNRADAPTENAEPTADADEDISARHMLACVAQGYIDGEPVHGLQAHAYHDYGYIWQVEDYVPDEWELQSDLKSRFPDANRVICRRPGDAPTGSWLGHPDPDVGRRGYMVIVEFRHIVGFEGITQPDRMLDPDLPYVEAVTIGIGYGDSWDAAEQDAANQLRAGPGYSTDIVVGGQVNAVALWTPALGYEIIARVSWRGGEN